MELSKAGVDPLRTDSHMVAAYGVLYHGTSYFYRSSPIERRGLVCRERRSYST